MPFQTRLSQQRFVAQDVRCGVVSKPDDLSKVAHDFHVHEFLVIGSVREYDARSPSCDGVDDVSSEEPRGAKDYSLHSGHLSKQTKAK